MHSDPPNEQARRDFRVAGKEAEHLWAALRKLAGTVAAAKQLTRSGLQWAICHFEGDGGGRLPDVESNIAVGLKTPKAAQRPDGSGLRRITLAEYVRAWPALHEKGTTGV